MNDQPPHLQDIRYRTHIESPAPAVDIQKMHEQVEATCPVLNTLRYPVEVSRKA